MTVQPGDVERRDEFHWGECFTSFHIRQMFAVATFFGCGGVLTENAVLRTAQNGSRQLPSPRPLEPAAQPGVPRVTQNSEVGSTEVRTSRRRGGRLGFLDWQRIQSCDQVAANKKPEMTQHEAEETTFIWEQRSGWQCSGSTFRSQR